MKLWEIRIFGLKKYISKIPCFFIFVLEIFIGIPLMFVAFYIEYHIIENYDADPQLARYLAVALFASMALLVAAFFFFRQAPGCYQQQRAYSYYTTVLVGVGAIFFWMLVPIAIQFFLQN